MEYDTQRLIYDFFETLDKVTEICTIRGTQAVCKVVRSRQARSYSYSKSNRHVNGRPFVNTQGYLVEN